MPPDYPAPPPPPPGLDIDLWDGTELPDDGFSLVELVNRVLDKGVVITGEITVSVAGVDLVYLGLNAVLTSISTAREVMGRQIGNREKGTGKPRGH